MESMEKVGTDGTFWKGADGEWKWPLWMAAAALAWAVWWDPSSGIADAALAGAGVLALARWGRLKGLWCTPAGAGFALLGLVALLSPLWGLDPQGSWRDLSKGIPLALGVAGWPVWLRRPRTLRRAMWLSAGMVTLRLVVDAARLVGELGLRGAFSEGRYLHPYLWTHPNVSSLLAGLAALVWIAGLRKGGWKGWGLAGALAGLAVDLFYLAMQGSRGPQAVTALAVVAWPALSAKSWKATACWALAGLAAAGALWATAALWNPRFADEKTMRGVGRREDIWNYCRSAVEKRPWLGYGYGKRAFRAMVERNPDLRAPRGMPFEFPHAHSYWLMLATQGGRLGLGAGVLAWGAAGIGLLATARRAKKAGRGDVRTAALALAAGMAVVLGYGVADYPDNAARMAQFLLAAAAMACTGVFRGGEEEA